MTQKELLYLEDAYMHEDNTICICSEIVELLDDENLVSFFEGEIKKHTSLRNKIMDLMEECLNG